MTPAKPFRFTAAMFENLGAMPNYAKDYANCSNAKLTEYLATLPRVSGNRNETWTMTEEICYLPKPGDTHTALLWGIEPVAKVKCEHSPKIIRDQYYSWYQREQGEHFECEKCGAKLTATWSESHE